MTVKYDTEFEGARNHVINCAVADCPIELYGASISHGSYSVKRGGSYLLATGSDVVSDYCPAASLSALCQLEVWLEEQIESCKSGVMQSLAESLQGDAVFSRVLEKVKSMRQSDE